ncbi:hypothetical protein HN814_02880 [Candidatus Woesearchaeota archaeon]|nr:hypothetical protein [Candidatus Woesearchaeota archaeon]
MIFLIISVPIAHAATINSVNAQGQGKIINKGLGYILPQDTLSILVNLTVPSNEDSDLGPGQVRILSEPTWQFDCSPATNISDKWVCGMEHPEFTLPGSLNAVSFQVQLFSDANLPLSPSKKKTVIVDRLAPTGTWEFLNNGSHYLAKYDISELACEGSGCVGKCSGVQELSFTVSESTIAINNTFGESCDYEGMIPLSLAVAGTETKHICMVLKDRIGHTSDPICQDVEIDKTPPAIVDVGLYAVGKKIMYSKGDPFYDVAIVMNISEDRGLKDNKIELDLTDFIDQPGYDVQYKKIPVQCSKNLNLDIYTCMTSGKFHLQVPQDKDSVMIGVRGEDINGNKLNISYPYNIVFDDIPPTLTKGEGLFTDESGSTWVKKEANNISLFLDESGSGFNNKWLTLDVSGFGTQDSTIGDTTFLLPNTCEDGWKCMWENLVISKAGVDSGDALMVNLVAPTKDDAGNDLSGFTSSVLHFDEDGPEFYDLSMVGVGTENLDDINFSIYGLPYAALTEDKLRIELQVLDHTPVQAFANFSKLYDEGMVHEEYWDVEGDCSETSAWDNRKVFTCVWETEPVLSVDIEHDPLFEDVDIDFRFVDSLGNTGEHEAEIRILGKENVSVDYWSYEWGGQSPKQGIDRFVWSISNPRSYQNFKLIGRNPGVRILSLDFDPNECTGLEYVGVSEENNQYAFNLLGYDVYHEEAEYNDLIEIVFDQGREIGTIFAEDEDEIQETKEIQFNCSFKILSLVNNQYISQWEEQNVTFVVGVYNNPLGTNLGNVYSEMEQLKTWINNDWWAWMDTAQTIIDYAKLVCQINGMLQKVMGLWYMIKDNADQACVSGITTQCAVGEEARGLGDVQRQATANDNSITSKLSTICSLLVSCRPTQPAKNEKDVAGCKKDTWCTIQKTWSKVNGWYEDFFTGLLGDFGKSSFTVHKGTASEFTVNTFNRGSFDPSRSIISSILTLCIPGIIHNFNKYRQLMCKKLMCLKTDVAYGEHKWVCDARYNYEMCVFFIGDLYNAVPWTQYIGQISKIIGGAIKNPVSAIGYIVDYVCRAQCHNSKSGMCYVCTAVEFLSVATSLAADVVAVLDWSVSGDICEEALKDFPDYSNFIVESDDEDSEDESSSDEDEPITSKDDLAI